MYPLKLRERLPVFAVPLRREDRDVALDLQQAIDLCSENSGLSARHYQLPPKPPLSAEDEAWAWECLTQAEE